MDAPKNPKGLRSAEKYARHRKLFAERYITNGNNAAEATAFCGLKPGSAGRMLNHPDVQAMINARVGEVFRGAQLSTERWAYETACIAHFDVGELYDADGNLIPIHKLPEHVRRGIASLEIEQGKTMIAAYDGDDKESVRTDTVKLKFWDKNAALANVGKSLGVFEADNRQKSAPIQVNVVLRG